MLLGGLVVAVYFGALDNGFAWDDRSLIVENTKLDHPGAWRAAFFEDFWESELLAGTSSYYRPLVTLTYIADRALYGVDPWGYHLTNLILHVFTVVVLERLLRAWGLDPVRAAFGAACFAVHPVLAESVAWVAGRTDTLATGLILASLLADRHRDRWAGRVGAPLLLAAALWAKEIAVVTPLIAWVAARGEGSDRGTALRRRVDLWLVLAAYFAVRWSVLGHLSGDARIDFPHEVLALAFAHVYGLMLAPWLGRIEYGGGLPANELLFSGGLGVVVAGLLARSRHVAPADAHRRLALAAAVAGLPMLGSIVLKGVIGDRLAYFPAAFAIPALASVAWAARERWGGRLAMGVLVGGLSLATLDRVPRWRSERALFTAAMAQPAPSMRTYLNYGIAVHDDGELPEGWDAIARAEAEHGTEQSAYMLALLFTELGCYTRAEPYYRQALARAPSDAAAANNLGGLLLERGRASEARAVLDAVIATGRSDARMRQNRAAMDSVPDAPVAVSDPPECASDELIRAAMRSPEFLLGRAVTLLRQRNLEAAKVVLRAVSRLQPDAVRVRFNWAQYYALANDPEQARTLLRGILAEQPNHGGARRVLEAIDAGSLSPRSE